MPLCKRCWTDADLRVWHDRKKTRTEHYRELLAERKATPCTPAQQKYGYTEPPPEDGHDGG